MHKLSEKLTSLNLSHEATGGIGFTKTRENKSKNGQKRKKHGILKIINPTQEKGKGTLDEEGKRGFSGGNSDTGIEGKLGERSRRVLCKNIN